MKNRIQRILLRTIAINTFFLLAFLFVNKYKVEWMISIRNSLFTRFEDPKYFSEKLSDLSDFKNANPKYINEYTKDIFAAIPEIKKIRVSNYTSEIEKAKAVVLAFSSNGGNGFSADETLLTKTKHIKYKNGLCSDHSEVFIALSLVVGLTSRETFNSGEHCFAELFDPVLQKWIWIDPQYALLAKDENGQYMSLIEMQNYYQSEKRINFEFFGNENHMFSNAKITPEEYSYFRDGSNFSIISLSMGNNVFTVDKFNQKYRWLPKSVRQVIGIVSGIQPSYIAHTPNKFQERKYLVLRICLITVIGMIFIINMTAIFQLMGITIGEKVSRISKKASTSFFSTQISLTD